MIYMRIDDNIEQVWGCEPQTYHPPVTFRRIRYADFGTPDQIVSTVHGTISYYLEVFLTGRILVCWTDTPLKASDVSEICTATNTILLKTGESIPCKITDRRPTDKEQEFIQQERLIESNYARVAKPRTIKPKSKYIERYEQILKVISNMVHVMERSPQSFSQMSEETLRDHILVQLNGSFAGKATGETFNYEGKTDILVRVAEKNIFIGECKFWTGAKDFRATIDQLLGYVAWRDTKAAIILFNRNKNTSAVLKQIPAIVKEHQNFKREVNSFKHETSFRFALNQRDDKKHDFILTVLVFDVPTLS